jgi:SAM-dependent methyltransferase
MSIDYSAVTEVSGEPGSAEQVDRMRARYYWAGTHCSGKDVLEVACGAGQGLGYLAGMAKSVHGGDISPKLVERARQHYGSRIDIREMDAQNLPFADASLDVVILFEAIYYLPDAARFVAECRRVLRPGGRVLIATANKDLFDFNPSPHSHVYYGVKELEDLFGAQGFSSEFFAHTAISETSMRQRVLRPVKKVVVGLGLMPKTMKGKQMLKRLVFGKLQLIPAEIKAGEMDYVPPTPVPGGVACADYKVIYQVATRA